MLKVRHAHVFQGFIDVANLLNEEDQKPFACEFSD